MPIFNDQDDLKDHKEYVTLLKKALTGVKGETKKNFVYFKQYPFGPKKVPVMLVDVAPAFKAILWKGAIKPVAEGKVGLTAQDQLDFDAEKGDVKRIQIKKYFSNLGTGIKAVYVPAGEVDPDEKPGTAVVGATQPKTGGSEQPTQEQEKEETLTQNLSPAMKKKLEFEEAQFKIRQRIEEWRNKAVPTPLEQLKAAALKKAAELARTGNFKDADLLLNQLAVKVSQPISPTPPTSTTQPKGPETQKAPESQPKAPESQPQSASEQYAGLKSRISAAMVPVTLTGMLYGPFKLLDESQKKLKAAEDDFNSKIGSADKKTGETLLKAIQDELPVTERLNVEASEKKKMNTYYGSRSAEIQKAQAKVKGDTPDWLTKPQGALIALVSDYKTKSTKATPADQKVLIDKIFEKLDVALEMLKKWDVCVAGEPTIDKAEAFTKAKLTDDTMKNAAGELKVALSNFTKGIDAADLNGTTALLQAVTDKLKPLQKLSAGRLTALNDGKTKPSVARAKAMELLKEDPDILKTIGADPAGRKFIDDMVKDLGGTVKDKDLEKDKQLKGFVKDALKARFDIDKLEGDLTSKALPRLYKVLGSIPEHHTVGNDKLKAIERKRDSNEGASWYKDEENLAQLNLERTGTFQMDYEGLNNSIVSSFDTTTLHEIGHSVDAKLKFMDNNQGNATYGGWAKIKVDDVVAVAGGSSVLGAKKAFFEEWKQYPKAFLENYLKQALKSQEESAVAALTAKPGDLEKDPAIVEAKAQREANKPEEGKKLDPKLKKKMIADSMKKSKTKDPNMTLLLRKTVMKVIDGTGIKDAVKEMLEANELKDSPSNADFKGMSKHPAVDWCHAVGLKGEHDGLWDKGKGGATKYAVNKTVYQEAYTNQWWKYSVDVRSKGVSDYQFRAPGEWFSELYSAYYLKAISKSHADYKWFTEKVHKVVPEAAKK